MFEVTGAKGLCGQAGWCRMVPGGFVVRNCQGELLFLRHSLQQLTHESNNLPNINQIVHMNIFIYSTCFILFHHMFHHYFYLFLNPCVLFLRRLFSEWWPWVPHPAAPAALRQVLLGPWPLVVPKGGPSMIQSLQCYWGHLGSGLRTVEDVSF